MATGTPIHELPVPEIPVIDDSSHEFCAPVKKLDNPAQFGSWTQSRACSMFEGFVRELSKAVKGRSLNEPVEGGDDKTEDEETTADAELVSKDKEQGKHVPLRGISAVVRGCVAMVDEMDGFLTEHPRTEQPTRYGNKAFRGWYSQVEREAVRLVREHVLSDDVCAQRTFDRDAAARELAPYVVASIGNYQRIDYGTGHEAAFATFMLCLRRLGIATADDNVALVTRVFNRYVLLMRKVQDLYLLEPAGSHGVWGLDDYQFLPFLWGASQLVGHQHIRPKSIHSVDVVSYYAKDYLYLAGIDFINKHKTGPFGEHSPLLFDISHVPHQLWQKLNNGLTKMYSDEVLHKFPVIQHTLFGSLFPLDEQPGAAPLVNSDPTATNASGSGDSLPTGAPVVATGAPWAASVAPSEAMLPPTGAAPWAAAGAARHATGTGAPWASNRR